MSMTSGSNNHSQHRCLIVRITTIIWLSEIGIFHLLANLSWPRTLFGFLAISLLILSLYVVWLSLTHMLVSLILRFTLYFERRTPPLTESMEEPVAVLVCTRDDWFPEVAEWCLTILRKHDHVFVCDDSQTSPYRSMVDAFGRRHPDQCTIVRRGSLQDFKAGNLNHCLSLIGDQFPFFAIVDHDTRLHPKTIPCAIDHFAKDESLAFVQFGLIDESPATSFEKELGVTIRISSWMQAVRSRYGSPLCIGRAVLLRTEAIRDCGGFPAVLCEDIGLTIRLLRCGRRGRHEPRFPAWERVPPDYRRFRARQTRWCIGTIQAWVGRSTRLPLRKYFTMETFDIFLQTLVLLYPVTTMLFVIGFLATAYYSPNVNPLRFIGIPLTTVLIMVLPSVSLVAIRAPLLRTLRMAATYCAVYLSLIIPVNVELITTVLSGKASFVNSGNRALSEANNTFSFPWCFHTNGHGTILIEIIAIIFMLANVHRDGWLALPLLGGLIASIVFQFASWDSRITQIATIAILTVIALAILNVLMFS
jgi:cellulose synthase/poly-beta-1,6-N-acetylglucosamine synthase-like glycosyltransferase